MCVRRVRGCLFECVCVHVRAYSLKKTGVVLRACCLEEI